MQIKDDICKKCNGQMTKSKVLISDVTIGQVTYTDAASGVFSDCMKCEKCGHSYLLQPSKSLIRPNACIRVLDMKIQVSSDIYYPVGRKDDLIIYTKLTT